MSNGSFCHTRYQKLKNGLPRRTNHKANKGRLRRAWDMLILCLLVLPQVLERLSLWCPWSCYVKIIHNLWVWCILFHLMPFRLRLCSVNQDWFSSYLLLRWCTWFTNVIRWLNQGFFRTRSSFSINHFIIYSYSKKVILMLVIVLATQATQDLKEKSNLLRYCFSQEWIHQEPERCRSLWDWIEISQDADYQNIVKPGNCLDVKTKLTKCSINRISYFRIVT